MYIYSDLGREHDPHALPDIELFYIDQDTADRQTEQDKKDCMEPLFSGPGWYWWSCFPGCLPDSEPIGPFETEHKAKQNIADLN